MDYEELDKKIEIIIKMFDKCEWQLTPEESHVLSWLYDVRSYLDSKENLEKEFNELFR